MKCIIVNIITSLNRGGAETMLYKLLSQMNHDKFENHVISLTGDGIFGDKIRALGIPVINLNMRSGTPDPIRFLRLLQNIRTIKPHIVHTWMYHAALLGFVVGKITGIKNICWNIRCSNMELSHYKLSTRLTIFICSLLSGYPSVIISNSKKAITYHNHLGYRPSQCLLIPNGFDLKKFRPNSNGKMNLLNKLNIEYEEVNDILLVGHIARYDPMKDHVGFIKAACKILKEGKDNIRFIMAGSDVVWTNEKLLKEIPESFKKKFYLLGNQNNIEKIVSGIDIFVLSSAFGEGFPNVVGEAMGCGIPCVVTDVGDSAVIVGDTGKVVPPKDSEKLAEGINSFLKLPYERRRFLGLQARKQVQSLYSIENITKQYQSLYQSLMIVETKAVLVR